MAVTLETSPSEHSINCFAVLDNGVKIGSIGISQHERRGYAHATVRFVSRLPKTIRRGQFTEAYALALKELALDVLESDCLMSKYAVGLWQRIKEPPGFHKFIIVANAPLSDSEPVEHYSDFFGEEHVCRPETRIWCLVRQGKEEYIALTYLKHPDVFDVVHGMHHFEEDY